MMIRFLWEYTGGMFS